MKFEKLLLVHGGGGEETYILIKEYILKYFSNSILDRLEDSAILTNGFSNLAFTIDGFTVKPIFFKGGDIGKLAITGTINDLVVAGAKPIYLTVSFIIEEGFLMEDFEKILKSMKDEAEKNKIFIVAGDTKIVPKKEVDGIFITTSGIGKIVYNDLSCQNLRPGDVIVVSGSIGDHGACILAEREGIKLDIELESDCESLLPLAEALFNSGIEIHAMRDPTRGGLAATLYEWAYSSQVNIMIEEAFLPVKPQVKAFCEILGFEPYHLPCEGRMVLAVPKKFGEGVLEILKKYPSGNSAQIIGRVLEKDSFPQVILKTLYGTERILENTSGEFFPRIC
ncbi:MAG: hydrogenase expression/formation protein HypE [Thermodesulfobacteriota bacterium]|nr:MAG: hydrogenase expression/formation protein HypE [Thermodesulfobacteriota bacterium]